ncbi:hypothetical protein BGW38_006352 [Lunasporangiospora selenospora]|uniref:Uncharacterized protein n=1 Tax=Lunasporangiospora selenospora TaxID=979761 RepID=A0A9P6KAS5_9FUNG|nr:hypothetical protein BGW38_006352 [Lunasporangiospora selenospora]
MVSFSNAFGLTSEEDAHTALISLLSSKLLPAKLRAAVSKTYELWRRNEGVVYWTRRMAGRKVDVSTGMTVDDLVDRGQKFTRKILQTTLLHGLTSTVQIRSSSFEIAAESEELWKPGDFADGSYERSATNQATDASSALEINRPKRQAIESEAVHKTKSRKKTPNGDTKAIYYPQNSHREQKMPIPVAGQENFLVATVGSGCGNSLFDDDEWNEILAKTRFDLPQLPRPTLRFLDKLRQSVIQGRHPNYVPLPDPVTTNDKDLTECILAQKTAAEWHFLYHKDPSPFVVDDLSESWWARESWAVLHDLLHDIPSIFMVDGEKRGLDSSRRRNMGRQFNPEEPARRRCGRKLDLICRDEQLRHDWMVVERMRHWDPQSTKPLKEFGCDILRETVTIAHNRMFEVSALMYTGFGFFQLHPVTEKSYVLVMERQQLHTLPRTKNNLQEPFKGLVKLLRIRTAMKSTIEIYRQLCRAHQLPESVAGHDQEAEKAGFTWMTEDPVGPFDPNIVVASSPIGPDDLSPNFDDEEPAYDDD